MRNRIARALNMEDRSIRVAFMIGDAANVGDTFGPWEIFQDTMIGRDNDHQCPFDLYTVAPTLDAVRMTGGLRVEPHYGLANSPQPDVIVVPSQGSDREMLGWLREAGAGAGAIIAAGAGVFQLARAGLLRGEAATTHSHDWDRFSNEFPDVDLRRGPAFVESGKFLTARDRRSEAGIALRVVQRYFGDEVACATAEYVEHDRFDWRDVRNVSRVAATPNSRWYCTW